MATITLYVDWYNNKIYADKDRLREDYDAKEYCDLNETTLDFLYSNDLTLNGILRMNPVQLDRLSEQWDEMLNEQFDAWVDEEFDEVEIDLPSDF